MTKIFKIIYCIFIFIFIICNGFTTSLSVEDKTEFYTYNIGPPSSKHFKNSNNYAYANRNGICERYIYLLIKSNDTNIHIKNIEFPSSQLYTIPNQPTIISNDKNENKTMLFEVKVNFQNNYNPMQVIIITTDSENNKNNNQIISNSCEITPLATLIQNTSVYKYPYKSEYINLVNFTNYLKYPYGDDTNNIEITIPAGSNNVSISATPMEYRYVSTFKFKLSFKTTHIPFEYVPNFIGSKIDYVQLSTNNLIFDGYTTTLVIPLIFNVVSYNYGQINYRQSVCMAKIITPSNNYFVAAFDQNGMTSDSILSFPVYGVPGNLTLCTMLILKNGVTNGGYIISSFENTEFVNRGTFSSEITNPIDFGYVISNKFEISPYANIKTVTAIGCTNRYDLSIDKTYQGDIKLDGFKIARFAQQTFNQIPFPYGYKNATSNTYYIELMTPVSKYLNTTSFSYSFEYTDWNQVYGSTLQDSIHSTDLVAPIVLDLKYINSYPTIKYCTIRVTVSDELSGVRSVIYTVMDSSMEKIIYIYNGYYSNIIQGLGTSKCIFDLPIPKQYLVYNFKIKVFDFAGNNNEYSINSPLVNLGRIESPPLKKLELTDIISFQFENNNIDVSGDGPYSNSLIFKLNTTTVPNYKDFIFEFNPIYHNSFYNQENGGAEGIENSQLSPPSFTSIWDESSGSHIINFTIPTRLFTGVVPYYIHPLHLDSSSLYHIYGSKSELIVNSGTSDVMPPIIIDIAIIGSNIGIPKLGDPPVNVGFSLTINDEYNGLVEANVTIISDVNLKGITFIKNYESSPLVGTQTIDFLIQITNLDIPQNYSISYISLKDSSGHISKYPDVNYLNPLFYRTVFVYWVKTEYQTGASISLDQTLPTLKSFKSTSTIITESIKQVEFIFTVEDEESGILTIKDGQDYSPIVYLTDSNNMVLSGVTIFGGATGPNNQSITYTSIVNVPYGFGVGENLLISIYGIYNNHMVLNGYSALGLGELGFTNYIEVNYLDNPFIQSINTIINSKVLVEGYRFGVSPSIQFVNSLNSSDVYSSSLITNFQNDTESNLFSFSFDLKNIPKMFSKPIDVEYYVQVIDSFGGVSNSNQTIKISSTVIPSISPAPTNKPQKCLGIPECGGSNQGYCSPTGCICKSPWIGNDCTSKVLIVPQPETNPTLPTTEIPIIDNNNNSETSNYLFKSLISIVSLRELDFNQIVIKNFTFDKWIFKSIDENTSNYSTSIIVNPISSNGSPTITNITVTLQWYKNESVVNFANEQIIMKPSSMKYTIEVSSYKFESNLNQLQLLIMASLESSKTYNICSSSEFGETSSGDNSNYIKIQIDNKSLYGRFIRRAIVDGYVLTIDNIPLDKSFNTIKEPSTLQSYIGITIPYYKSSVTVDPDFSVLVNSKTVSNDDENSICSNNGNGGLTKSQLIGIIIGSVVIGCAIICTVAFVFLRKSIRVRVFVKKIKMKNYKS